MLTRSRTFFAVRGGYLSCYSQKNKEGVSPSNSDYKIQNYVAGKHTRARTPLARKYTNRIFKSKDDTASMKIVN